MPRAVELIQQQRNAGRRCVAGAVDVAGHAGRIQLQAVAHRVHDALVGLVEQHPIHLVQGDAGFLCHGFQILDGPGHREAVHILAQHL